MLYTKDKPMKKIILLLIMTLPLLMHSFTATSHSGRTDANGGHYNHFTGEYHYHNNGTYQSRNSSSSNEGTNGYINDIIDLILFVGPILLLFVSGIAYEIKKKITAKKDYIKHLQDENYKYSDECNELKKQLEQQKELLDLICDNCTKRLEHLKDVSKKSELNFINEISEDIRNTEWLLNPYDGKKDLRKALRLLNKLDERKYEAYKQKDARYDYIESFKQFDAYAISAPRRIRTTAVMKEHGKPKGKDEYTYDVDLIKFHISLPCDFVKGEKKEYAVELCCILYAYHRHTNETQFHRFVQSEAKKGVIVRNLVSYTQPCEVVSTKDIHFTITLLNTPPPPWVTY